MKKAGCSYVLIILIANLKSIIFGFQIFYLKSTVRLTDYESI